MCPVVAGLGNLVGATSCCTAAGVCGLMVETLGVGECLELDAPGTENTSCPGVTIANLIPLAGCCRPDGMCGALDTLLGLGCANVSVGNPVRCTP